MGFLEFNRNALSYDPNTVNRQRPTSRKSLAYIRWQIRTCVPEDRCETDVLTRSLISADTAARAARTSPLPARRRAAAWESRVPVSRYA